MIRGRTLRRLALLSAAGLIGAGGLASEAIQVSAAGLALGFGRASAWGIAVFVAGYAAGSWSAGRFPGADRRRLALLGALALAAPWTGVRAILAASSEGWSAALAAAAAVLALGGTGWIQGALLPCLLRLDRELADSRGVALLFGANLLGGVAGAHFLAFEVAGEHGRSAAALGAGSAAFAGALLACAAARDAGPASGARSEPAADRLSPARAAVLVGLGTAWAVAVEWIGLRHALLWLESQEATLSAVLAASLCALALGALASSLLPRGRAGALLVVPFLVAGTWWVAHGAEFAFARAQGSRFAFCALLLGPALAGFGAWIPALYRASSGEVGARLGNLLVHEAWGALLGAPLAQALGAPRLGWTGALAVLAAQGALFAALLAPRARAGLAGAALVAALSAAAAVLLARAPEPALRSPLYADPALAVRSFALDPQFAVGVVDDGVQGERTLLTDRFRAAGTGRDYAYMRALGHLPLLLHPAPRRVAVMCLGTGTTLGAASLHSAPTQLDVLEISPAVVAAAPWFLEVNRGALEPGADLRVHVRIGDGRRLLADSPGGYDVLTMEPLLPDSPFGVYLYTGEFYRVARRALAPGGLVCQWVPPHALTPPVFDAVVDGFARAFPWSGRFLFGTQLVLIGAEREPALDPARFPAPGSELGRALARVNLDSPGALLSTFRGAAPWPAGPRALTDDAPWIVFEDKPGDARVLGWLGANLARLEEQGAPAPATWRTAAGPHAARFERAGELLARARRECAEREANLRAGGAQLSGAAPALAELAGLAEAGELGRALIEEQSFLAHLRQGVASIGLDAHSAADHLLSAAELRGERADVHLYVSAALAGLGEELAARAALARALELCPRALETPAGVRAAALGLPAAPR